MRKENLYYNYIYIEIVQILLKMSINFTIFYLFFKNSFKKQLIIKF